MVGADGVRVAVVIPAYRAADTIEKVLGGIPAWVDGIYVVDDASPDETGAKVRKRQVFVDDTKVKAFMVVPSLVGGDLPPGALSGRAEHRSGRLKTSRFVLGSVTVTVTMALRLRLAQIERLWAQAA